MIAAAVRYGIVGLISVGLYIATTWYLAEHQIGHRTVAIFAAFALATIFNYVANYYWSFAGEVPHQQSVIRYLILVIAGLIWNELGVELMFFGGIPLMTAVLICAATWPLLSFVCQRVWVFGSHECHPN
jgi:putative flippase GtrA